MPVFCFILEVFSFLVLHTDKGSSHVSCTINLGLIQTTSLFLLFPTSDPQLVLHSPRNVLLNDRSVCSWCDGSSDRPFMVDPLSYFSFQPVLHNWCNNGCGVRYPVCGMMHIKQPLLLNGTMFRQRVSPLAIQVVLYHVWRHITINKTFSFFTTSSILYLKPWAWYNTFISFVFLLYYIALHE